MQLFLLLFPIAALIGYFFTDSFVLRSLTTILCFAIVVWVGVSRPRLRGVGWVAIALAFSLAGDYVLGHWGGGFTGFVSGVGLFLLAHLAYMAYSLRCGRMAWWFFAALAVVFGVYYVALVRPAISDGVTRTAVLAYILVSCLSMAAALGIGKGTMPYNRWARLLFIVGIGSLLFSDFLIAQKRFLHEGSLYMLMMPTYFASQILVTAAVVWQRLWQKGRVFVQI